MAQVVAPLEEMRARLEKHRAAIREKHLAGAPGSQVAAELTAMVDGLILGAVRSFGSAISGWAVIALGGYGRKELAPFSDIDLLFLFHPAAEKTVDPICRAVLHLLWDLRFEVGHSTRTTRQCLEAAATDFTARTSFTESRLLAGDPEIAAEFSRRVARMLRGRHTSEYIQWKVRERFEEYERFGSTVHLLEPDIKRSKGGLRDLHALRWIGLARYGARGIEGLKSQGVISPRQKKAVLEAQEFLWRVRNDLHFHAGKATDVLSMDEQRRLAVLFGYRDEGHILGVERFMQQYYRHSLGLHETVLAVIRAAQPVPWRRRLRNRFTSRIVERRFRLTSEQITPLAEHRGDVLASPEQVLDLLYHAQRYGVRVEESFLEEVQGRSGWPGEPPPHLTAKFLAILRTLGAGATLRLMYRLRLLEWFIPEFTAVHCLAQFNQYHKFTVDEHCLQAVEHAEDLARDRTYLGGVYREIRRKDLLHLGLLLHDLGKGQGDDHSLVGEKIAANVAARLGLSREDAQTLRFLVRNHLLMSNVAFRRDLTEEGTLVRFTRQMGQPELLKMFLVLTHADLRAVGPGTWTNWKDALLRELFEKALEELAGTRPTFSLREHIEGLIRELVSRLGDAFPEAVIVEYLHRCTERYLSATLADRVATHFKVVAGLRRGEVRVEVAPGPATTEVTVFTHDDIIPGLFYRVSGVLAARGIQIHGAQVHTMKDGVVIDTFIVSDPTYDPVPSYRWEEISGRIKDVLLGRSKVEDLFSARVYGRPGTPPRPGSTQVEIDNESSDHYTIIDVFADDRQGLLYRITRALFEQGLSVSSARVATRLDQIVDVFYVTSREGGVEPKASNKNDPKASNAVEPKASNTKVTDSAALLRIKEAIREAIERPAPLKNV